MSRHDHPGLFKKGQSGNPKGKAPLTSEHYEFKRALEAMLPLANQRLQEMLDSDDFEKHRFAIPLIHDRTQGKAVERKELTGADGGKIQIEDSTPSIRLLLQQALPQEVKTIEGEKE